MFYNDFFDRLSSLFCSFISPKKKQLNKKGTQQYGLVENKKRKVRNFFVFLVATFGVIFFALLGVRIVANRIIFQGTFENIVYDDLNISSAEIKVPKYVNSYLEPYLDTGNQYDATRTFVQIGDLKGCSYKFKFPESIELKDKCVIVFGPNATSVQWISLGLTMSELLNRGATVVAVDYRGYGYSKLVASPLFISQGTLYSDGETIFNYVIKDLNYNPQNILVFGFSLGGSVASHVAAYACEKGCSLGGLILASPISSLGKVATNEAYEILAMLTKLSTMSELDTEKNLRSISNKNLPLFICSGDKEDFLSLRVTFIDRNAAQLGFVKLYSNVQGMCGHNYLDRMFSKETLGVISNQVNSSYQEA